jgi:hypothetical protein
MVIVCVLCEVERFTVIVCVLCEVKGFMVIVVYCVR